MKNRIHVKVIIYIIGIISIFRLTAFEQFNNNYWETKRKAFLAETPVECQSCLETCNEVLKVNPYHPVMNHLAARLNEQLGNSKLALKYLKKAAKLGVIHPKPVGLKFIQ